jgi:hypothetical protein
MAVIAVYSVVYNAPNAYARRTSKYTSNPRKGKKKTPSKAKNANPKLYPLRKLSRYTQTHSITCSTKRMSARKITIAVAPNRIPIID